MLTQSRKDAKENAKNAAWSPAGFAPLRLCVRNLFWSSIILLLVIPPSLLAQRTPQKQTGLTEEQLPAFAVSLVISLATEARSYSDVALRPRVLARAADVIWDADNVNARALFKRAWEEAEQGDRDEVTIKTKDNAPAMVTAMRRMSGRDLRAEVLTMIAKRDRALSEEFLAKLKSESDLSKEKSAPLPQDDWFVAEAVSKRIQVATALLKDGQTDKALEFAAPVLTSVNTQTVNFLSELRTKNAEAAEAIRLAQTGKLSNTQRAAAYIDIANLLRDTERQKSLELIEEAVREANRIEGNKPDRAVLFIGIANQLMTVDRVRAWEIMGEVVKEANRVEGFTGEDVVRFSLMTGSGVRFQRIGGENFNLANVFRALAKDDLYRAVEVAKSFKYEAPRSTVTLAIASSILVREADGSIKPGAQAPGSQLIRKNTSPR